MIQGPVAILGLGLIGGSLARDLAARGVVVWGFDTDAAATRHARRSGVIAHVIDAGFRALAEARTVVIAVPVDAAPALLERAAEHAPRAGLITDVGSTKHRIVQCATKLGLGANFVGSHPMAGDHRSGWHASRRGLFDGARVDLCRTPQTTVVAWKRARALWRATGAVTAEVAAVAHDAEMAFSSHLPQLLSVALSGTLAARAIPRRRLGSGGRDMTRMAASSAAMWTAVLEDNAVPVLDALDTCMAQLGSLRRAVEQHDRQAMAEAFNAAHRWSETTDLA